MPDLSAMLEEAYLGMMSENMSCPWCGGRLEPNREYHYAGCDWVELHSGDYAIVPKSNTIWARNENLDWAKWFFADP